MSRINRVIVGASIGGMLTGPCGAGLVALALGGLPAPGPIETAAFFTWMDGPSPPVVRQPAALVARAEIENVAAPILP